MATNRVSSSFHEFPIDIAKLVVGGTAGNSYALDMLINSPILSILQDTGGGIAFFNSPNIAVAHAAQYSPVELTHTNYDYNSFGKSSITNMSVTGKFTAQTLEEADYLLAVIHFLRTFTKMNFGEGDQFRGQPPAILKFSAYGQYMMSNIPVAIRVFTLNLPDHVDYVHTSFGTQVPVYMEITMDLVPMLTPQRVKDEFTLEGFANGSLIQRGFL